MKQPECELNELIPATISDEEIKQRGLLSQHCLKEENQKFKGTQGISQNNQHADFVPAFQDKISGTCVISRFADGSPAPVHVLDGLPIAWITGYDEEGHVSTVRKGIVAGFLRDAHFYTRDEAAVSA
ncbi:MAG: dihydroorotase [Sedimenticola sp.]|nr:dihydroorotase [Sedimenticola sp.]